MAIQKVWLIATTLLAFCATGQDIPVEDFWHARNSLTQRAIGPESIATTEVDGEELKDGDIAGLALLNYPYAWIGISREGGAYEVQQYDQRTNMIEHRKTDAGRIWFHVQCNFDYRGSAVQL